LHWYNAIDFDGQCGDPIFAAAGGKVLKVKLTSSTSRWAFEGAGNHLTILHPNGVVTFYGHLLTSFVNPGDQVSQGQIIALTKKNGVNSIFLQRCWVGASGQRKIELTPFYLRGHVGFCEVCLSFSTPTDQSVAVSGTEFTVKFASLLHLFIQAIFQHIHIKHVWHTASFLSVLYGKGRILLGL
jgi:hypothetical protein